MSAAYFIESDGGKSVAEVPAYQADDEGLANARLVTAAPELLEALRATAELLDHAYAYNSKVGDRLHTEHPRVWSEALAAIAKAEGKS